MTKSLGKSVINQYSNVVCNVLDVYKKQDFSDDLECDPFFYNAVQRFTCDLYWCFLAPVSVGIITGKHYAKHSVTKLNDGSNNGK